MANRKLAYIVRDQKPLVLAAHETVQQPAGACGLVVHAHREFGVMRAP